MVVDAYSLGKEEGKKEQQALLIKKINLMQTHIETFIAKLKIDSYARTIDSAKRDLEYFMQIKEVLLSDSTPAPAQKEKHICSDCDNFESCKRDFSLTGEETNCQHLFRVFAPLTVREKEYCEWTPREENKSVFDTSCGWEKRLDNGANSPNHTECDICGKPIKIKEEK
jgi:hypothetical protein